MYAKLIINMFTRQLISSEYVNISFHLMVHKLSMVCFRGQIVHSVYFLCQIGSFLEIWPGLRTSTRVTL